MSTQSPRISTGASAPKHRDRHVGAEVPGPRPADSHNLAGTGTLIRFMLRRDRLRIPVWLGALTLGTVVTADSLGTLYSTPAEQAAVARSMSSPAALAMTGPQQYLTDYNVGAMMGHQMLGIIGVLVGLMSVLLLSRHTRAEEETGRAELVRAGIIGRHAHLAAALSVVIGANLALAVLITLGMGSLGIAGVSWAPSLLYGLAHAAMGSVFAGVAAVTVQIFEHSRAASGATFAVVGLAYVLRAAGDVGSGAASWLSPIGWAQRTFVYVDNRWWPLLLAVGATVALVAVAARLSTRRDVGSALRPARGGAATASAGLLRPIGLAVRLHRGMLLGFATGLFLLGATYGSILDQVADMLATIEGAEKMLAGLGGSITEAFVSRIILVTAIISTIYPVVAVSKMRAEETAGRAEPLLATALPRHRWLAGHAAVALVGGPVVLLCAALGIGLPGAAVLGDPTLIPRVLGAALAYVPALWVTTSVAIALFGWLPRATPLTWFVVVYAFVVGYLGQLLRFPGWMSNLSPFGHVPAVPVADVSATPLVLLAAVAAALLTLGLAGLRHRDLEAV